MRKRRRKRKEKMNCRGHLHDIIAHTDRSRAMRDGERERESEWMPTMNDFSDLSAAIDWTT